MFIFYIKDERNGAINGKNIKKRGEKSFDFLLFFSSLCAG